MQKKVIECRRREEINEALRDALVVMSKLQWWDEDDVSLAGLLAHLTNGLFDVRKEVQNMTVGVDFD